MNLQTAIGLIGKATKLTDCIKVTIDGSVAYLEATDSSISLRVLVEERSEALTVYVQAQALQKIVGIAKDQLPVFATNGTRLVVRIGKSRLEFATLPEPVIDSLPTITWSEPIDPEPWLNLDRLFAIQRCGTGATKGGHAFAYSTMLYNHADKCVAAMTDGFMMFSLELPKIQGLDFEPLLVSKTYSILQHLFIEAVADTQNNLQFGTSRGTLWLRSGADQVRLLLLDGSAPPITGILNTPMTISISTSPELVSSLRNAVSFVEGDRQEVFLELSADALVVSAQGSNGRFENHVSHTVVGNVPTYPLGFRVGQILGLLEKHKGDELNFALCCNDAKRSATIRYQNNNFSGIVNGLIAI